MFNQLEESSDRAQLRASVADFVRRETRPTGGAKVASPATACDARRWRQIAALGWLGLQLPESCGGIGLAHGDLAVLHQEIGRGALAEPLIAVATLAARSIARGTNESLQRSLLPQLVSGEQLASLAWQKSPGGVAGDEVGPLARARGDGWVIEGDAMFVPAAAQAHGLVVAARAPHGVLLAWLPRTAGWRIETATLADGTDAATHVRFDGQQAGAADVVAAPGPAAELLAEVLDTASLAASAELLGAMEQMLEMTVAYMNQRVQFGKPIGSYQALQHRAVDVYVQVELARSSLGHAVARCDAGATGSERAQVVSQAKSRCSDAGMLAVKHCIQMHGAIAYTDEYPLSRHIRRVIALAASHGTAAAHRRRYARLHPEFAGD